VGDIMFHEGEINAAYDKKTKEYNFDYDFKYIKDIISSADIALGNFECTFGGPNKVYSKVSIKSFSVPDAAADALKNAGFDILSAANNHINDRSRDGLIRTVKTMQDKGITCIGARADTSEKKYYITDVKGVKIGFTAYTFNSRNSDLVNSYSTSNITNELSNMSKVVQDMRSDGAEIVVFFIHWGTEYSRQPNSTQKKLAQGLADAGVDIIFGSHPHWMQTVDLLTSAKTGKKTVVAYSLGNFISNQRSSFQPFFKYSEDCMILNVKIVKQPGGSAQVSSVEYLPTWTLMYNNAAGKRLYTVIPLEKALAKPESYDITTNANIKKAQTSLNNTQSLLASAVADGDLTLMKLD